MFADLALKKVLSLNVNSILDIGCGSGEQAHLFHDAGKMVYALDIYKHPSLRRVEFIKCRFPQELPIISQVDCVWCSHILEHQLNVNLFLTKALDLLKEGGYMAITVPPAKKEVVGGHVSIWNAGLVLYNLILAGTSCREAYIKTYGYNISVIVKKKRVSLPDLKYDRGDIDTLKDFFPEGLGYQGFNGEIAEYNW